jgi:hypothetical protein
MTLSPWGNLPHEARTHLFLRGPRALERPLLAGTAWMFVSKKDAQDPATRRAQPDLKESGHYPTRSLTVRLRWNES